jgi:quercetin dioxygenase-like cupin family protein
MPKRSKPASPASDVLDPEVVLQLAAAVAPAELTQAEREALHTRIMQRIGDAPPPPGTQTIRAADMQWRSVGPGVEVKVLRANLSRHDQTVLIRMQPGAVVVGHPHTQEEECLVLEGEVFLGDHRLGQGDMHVAAPGAVHAPIRAPHGALLMIRSEMPPRGFRIA